MGTSRREGLGWMFLMMLSPWYTGVLAVPLARFAGQLTQQEAWFLYATTYTLMAPLFILMAWVFGSYWVTSSTPKEQ